MLKYFGTSAIREYGEYSETGDFFRFCEHSDDETIKRVFELCEQQLARGNQFAPTVGTLSQMNLMITDTEYYTILDCVRNSDSEHENWRVDWILRRHSTDIRMTKQDLLRKTVAALYAQAVRRGRDACSRKKIALIADYSARDERVSRYDISEPNILQIVQRINNLRKVK